MQPSPGPLWGLYADSLFVGRLVRKNDPFTGLVLNGTVTHGPWLVRTLVADTAAVAGIGGRSSQAPGHRSKSRCTQSKCYTSKGRG